MDKLDTIRTHTAGEYGFDYVFYRDPQRPDVVVSAMTVIGYVGGVILTRLTWQAGDNLRTVRLEINEFVCERPIITVGGVRYDLEIEMRNFLSGRKIRKEGEPRRPYIR